MKVLVINCGSSSFKYQLIDITTQKALCSGLVERIGATDSELTHKRVPGTSDEKKFQIKQSFPDHTAGMEAVMKILVDSEKGVLTSLEEIQAVGHRVVLGGEALKTSCVVGEKEKKVIADLSPLAPLHNPANLQGIEVAQKLLPHAPSVAVFDTEFHATLPPKAYTYAVPYEYYENLHIRKYGYHGTSHQFVAQEAAKEINKPFDQLNVITCHLGNGCSISAIQNGKCIDTSMGMTPLAGVMMGTRCGDLDPGIYTFLCEQQKISPKEVDSILNKNSGLKGICGLNDLRDIHAACEKGDEKAKLALDMFCYDIRKYIGSYYAILGRLDALVFTAGVGENDDIVRNMVCSGLEHMGITIDATKNAVRSGNNRAINKDGGQIPVLVIPTNEELAIAIATVNVLQ